MFSFYQHRSPINTSPNITATTGGREHNFLQRIPYITSEIDSLHFKMEFDVHGLADKQPTDHSGPSGLGISPLGTEQAVRMDCAQVLTVSLQDILFYNLLTRKDL